MIMAEDPLGSAQWDPVPAAGGWGGLRSAGGVLEADAALPQHAAQYRCSADNGVGPPLHHDVTLQVHGMFSHIAHCEP